MELKKVTFLFLSVVALAGASLFLTGCEKKSDADKAADAVQDVSNDAAKEANKAADAVKDLVK